MRILKSNILPLSLLVLMLIINLLYMVLDKPGLEVHSLVSGLDRTIPFIKVFALPYIAWYLFIPITLCYFCFRDKTTYYKATISLITGLLVCYAIYYFFQTTVPRPVLSGNDLLTKIVGFIYRMDRPFNCFPSIHSLTSYLMIKAISDSTIKNRLNSLIIKGVAILIIASTLFIKQHVILDAAMAMFIGEIIFRLVSRLNEINVTSVLREIYNSILLKERTEIGIIGRDTN